MCVESKLVYTTLIPSSARVPWLIRPDSNHCYRYRFVIFLEELLKTIRNLLSVSMSTSPSPTRARSPIDRTNGSPPSSPGGGAISETYRSAMKKLVDAAWKFDKESNDYYFKSLENRQLDKELFRQGLRQSMNCKLSPAEFDSLYPLF